MMDYNSTRPKLILSEYGRNIQNMVSYITGLPTKEERNLYAQTVIDLMGQLNPHLRDVVDFKHKLWDHLFIISDFKIDVDSPYPKPSRDILISKPDRLSYPTHNIKYMHYGKTVELMIEKLKTIEDPDRKAELVESIANFMKMAYVTWNKDNVSDETIISDLKQLSGGEIALEEGTNLNRVETRNRPRQNQGQHAYHNKQQKHGHKKQHNKKKH